MINLDKYFSIANKVVGEVSQYLLTEFGTIKAFKVKGPSDITIKQDAKANLIYEKYLRKKTPEALLFTEEGTKKFNDGLVWVIDPIEGTSNYRVGIPFFATTICLTFEGSPVISIVSAPALKQKFTAIRDKGAFLNSRKIKPSEIKELSQAMISVGRGRKKADKVWQAKTLTRLLPKVRTIRTLGSAGLDMAYSAAGMLDIYLARGLEAGRIYDIFPGYLLLKESGATTVNQKGQPYKLGDELILASNDNLVKQVLRVL